MTEQSKTFKLSNRFITNRRRLMMGFTAAIVGCIILVMLVAENFDFQRIGATQLYFVIGFSGIILSAIFVMGIFMERRWRQFRLHLRSGELVIEASGSKQEVAWENITKVRIMTSKLGEPRGLEIRSKSGRPMLLFGIESMTDIVRQVQSKLPSTAVTESKRQWFDWENQWPMIAIVTCSLVIGLLIAVTGGHFGGESVKDALFGILSAALGSYILICGPISRTNPGFRKFEIFFGFLTLIGGLIHLMSALW